MIYPGRLLTAVIRPALHTLPPNMRGRRAECLLLAIALQESGLRHREQIGGPAKGIWQFENVGIRGVLDHPSTFDHAHDACEAWLYPVERRENGTATLESVDRAHAAVRDNDLLATIFARLALWRLPDALPEPDEGLIGWDQYLRAWRPGKPHPERWADHWATALQAVEAAP